MTGTALATALGTSLPTASPAPAPTCAQGGKTATLVAYADAGDLWLYDSGQDRSRQLTIDGEARFDRTPAFASSSCLVFSSSGPASIELLDLGSGGSRRSIVEEHGAIASLDVSPDGTSVIYLQIDFDVDATYRLKRVGIGGGAAAVLYTFDANLGRGGSSEDEVSVAWSPEGSHVLVANTHESSTDYPTGAIYLFDATGRELVDRWKGTHPRWSPDGATIYYRGHASEDGQSWRTMDLGSMRSTNVGFRSGTNGLAISPDGRHVAYDTSWFGGLPIGATITPAAPVAYLYDLATGKETVLKLGALQPAWISARDVLVTNARAPAGPTFNSWESLKTVSRISVGGDRARVKMTSTMFDIDVYIGS